MEIESRRLRQCPIVPGHLPTLFELFSDPVAMQFFPSTKDFQQTHQWFNEVERRKNRDGLTLRVIKRKQDNAILGYCGLILQKNVAGADEIEVGYGLLRRYWGCGYATEAAAACLEKGFLALEIDRIISLIRPENTASVAVALRNGLRFENSVQRWRYQHNVYAIGRTDFIR
jgi:RimJ/RimL family protein N-acetyltransferase